MPPARLNSLEARPGHVGVQPGNKGSTGELGEDRSVRSGLMTALAETEDLAACTDVPANYFLVIVVAV